MRHPAPDAGTPQLNSDAVGTQPLPRCVQALLYAKGQGALCVGVTNTVGSAIAAATDCGVHVNAGCEIGVASTKAYTSQIVAVTLLALVMAEDSVSRRAKYEAVVAALARLPELVRQVGFPAPEVGGLKGSCSRCCPALQPFWHLSHLSHLPVFRLPCRQRWSPCQPVPLPPLLPATSPRLALTRIPTSAADPTTCRRWSWTARWPSWQSISSTRAACWSLGAATTTPPRSRPPSRCVQPSQIAWKVGNDGQ